MDYVLENLIAVWIHVPKVPFIALRVTPFSQVPDCPEQIVCVESNMCSFPYRMKVI